jgi:argininosuccinate lyase
LIEKQKDVSKPWGGRFAAATDAEVERFTASEHFDRRLARFDIQGSIAHARMLATVGVLSEGERDAIVEGLRAIAAEIEAGEFPWSQALEDVHMNIERRLTERIGEPGKKLHTARSRNDQVATDMRLFLRDAIDAARAGVAALESVLVEVAEREADTVMPGFTHLQTAQPVTFGHHVLAWVEMLERDRDRLADCRRRTDVMPLGSAALAGTSFAIDREHTREALGFPALSRNSLDAVSDRDFAIEFCAAASIMMVHLSRMCEELILWMSERFRFIDIDDAFCTGSSIMPQKKNPDVAELVRGKSARVIGHLTAMLVLMKGQPLAYNRDNQEDKEPLFDTVDTVLDSLRVLTAMWPGVRVNREVLREAARGGFATATDLAEYLVRRGVPFRDAHEAVGRAVALAQERGVDLADLPLEDLRAFCPLIEPGVYEVLTLEGSLAARAHVGGTAPQRVRAEAARIRALLEQAAQG